MSKSPLVGVPLALVLATSSVACSKDAASTGGGTSVVSDASPAPTGNGVDGGGLPPGKGAVKLNLKAK